jgi:hypothetical protein
LFPLSFSADLNFFVVNFEQRDFDFVLDVRVSLLRNFEQLRQCTNVDTGIFLRPLHRVRLSGTGLTLREKEGSGDREKEDQRKTKRTVSM